MPTHKGPAKGKTGTLAITQTAQRRFVVGLSWNPRNMSNPAVRLPQRPQGFPALLLYWLKMPFELLRVFFQSVRSIDRRMPPAKDNKKTDRQGDAFDLDLECYIYDGAMRFVRRIGPDADSLIDPSGKIYHSGEDQSGYGGPDDETIAVETKGLPGDCRHFFFVVRSGVKYSIEEIHAPAIRLADGASNEDALESALNPPPHYNAHGFIFCHVWQDGDVWRFRNIHEYAAYDVDWQALLPTLSATGGTT